MTDPVQNVEQAVSDATNPHESVAERVATAFEDLSPELQEFITFVSRHLGVNPPVTPEKPVEAAPPPPPPQPVWNAAAGKWELPA